MSLRYDISTLADRVEAALAGAEADLRLEQAVYGLDSMDELAIQRLLAERLAGHYGVQREVYYPSSQASKRTHRKRCDIVLTPKAAPLRDDGAPPGLFDPPAVTAPSHALWLEVKVAYQFREGGVRHSGYGPQWRSAIVEDLRKMEADPLIREAALVMVVFTESQEIIDKDLGLFELVLVQKEVLAGFRQVRTIKITERIGHRLCTAACWPTIQR